MNLMDALKSRRSIRRYQSRPIPKDLAKSLIDAAQTAPSAGNLSARRYVLVSNEDMRRLLAAAAYGQEHIEEAPLLIAVCADVKASSVRYGSRGGLYAIQDADAATMCLLLAAHDAPAWGPAGMGHLTTTWSAKPSIWRMMSCLWP